MSYLVGRTPAEIKFDSTVCQLSAFLFISKCAKYLQTARDAYDQNFIRKLVLFGKERRSQNNLCE